MATWREELTAAFKAVEAAERHRAEVLAAALNAGLSTRQIAVVVGRSASTVWRLAGGKRVELDDGVLDRQASLPKQEPE